MPHVCPDLIGVHSKNKSCDSFWLCHIDVDDIWWGRKIISEKLETISVQAGMCTLPISAIIFYECFMSGDSRKYDNIPSLLTWT